VPKKGAIERETVENHHRNYQSKIEETNIQIPMVVAAYRTPLKLVM
jgi:hypothetical protein